MYGVVISKTLQRGGHPRQPSKALAAPAANALFAVAHKTVLLLQHPARWWREGNRGSAPAAVVAKPSRSRQGGTVSGQGPPYRWRGCLLPFLPALGTPPLAASGRPTAPVFLTAALFGFAQLKALRRRRRAAGEPAIQLASLQLGVLTTLCEAAAIREPQIASHQAVVAHYARTLAAALGLEESEGETVHTAGLLHDLGLFLLPDHLLRDATLSDEEWEEIRRHPTHGARLVGRLSGFAPVAEAILSHHERFDGSGYPAGLIAGEIPLAARILAVCEAYAAMTDPGPYREPLTPGEAFAELRKGAGTQFDPELVEAFVASRTGQPNPLTRTDYRAELAAKRPFGGLQTAADPSGGER